MSKEAIPSKQEGPNFVRVTGLVAAGTFLSRILGLLREQVSAYFFGAGIAMDAFNIAFRIPNLLRDLFAEGAMSSALIPVYTRLRMEKGEEAGWHLVSNVATTLALVLGLISVLGILGADALVGFYAPAFHSIPGKHELTVSLTRILWPFFPLVVMAAVWMGILNSRHRYGTPALAPSIFNIISIASAFTLAPLFEKWLGLPRIYGWAIGATLGGLGQWLVQVPTLAREGFRFSFVMNWRDPALRSMVWMMGAGTFGLGATQINILVNSVLASGQEGAVSWLNYAFRLMQFPIGVFGVAISTANLTRVAREHVLGDYEAVRKSLLQALRMVVVLTVPSAVGLAVFGGPIVSVIYERGRFHSGDTFNTALALAGYSIGLTAYSAVKVLVPVLYSLGRSGAAILSSGLSVILNISLCLLMVRRFGFVGLTLALSGSALLNFALLLWLMERYVKEIDFLSLWSCFWRTLCASGGMAIFIYSVLSRVGMTPFRAISLTSFWLEATFSTKLIFLTTVLVAAVAIFVIIGKILGLHEIEQIRGLVWKRIRKRREK